MALAAIEAYRLLLSPFFGGACRFHPSCSDYAREAIETKGLIGGTWLAVRRLARCHPWGGYGFDPVPGGPASAGTTARTRPRHDGDGCS